jgi:cyanophycinase
MMSAGPVLAVGGAEDKFGKRTILRRFVREAGGAAARIAIVPTASSIPEKRISFYEGVFADIGAAEAFGVTIATREEADSAEAAEKIRSSTGVFLTGGDQSRLVAVLAGTAALAAIVGRHRAGAAIAGTSAAASAFSTVMIAGGGTGLTVRPDAVDLARGFGILDALVIDQHFSQRERLGRLLSAVAQEPARLGVGLDEDTAVLCHEGELEVLGSGHVFVLDPGAQGAVARAPFALSGILIHVLRECDRFDLRSREVVALSRERAQEVPA